MKIILVTGPSGSGKSTVTDMLIAHSGVERCLKLSTDEFYEDLSAIPLAERADTNFDAPPSIDISLLLKIVATLKGGQSTHVPEWDFKSHTRKRTTHQLDPAGKDFLFIEGIFAMEDQLKAVSDVAVYVNTHAGYCLLRRIERDIKERGRTPDSVLAQSKKTVLPMQIAHIEPKKEEADVVIENNKGPNEIDISPYIAYMANLDDSSDFEHLQEDVLAATSAVLSTARTWLSPWATAGSERLAAATNALATLISPEDAEEKKAPTASQ